MQSESLSKQQLRSKSTADLQEILNRQERLLSKRKFLHSLPDHGRKIEEFAALLRVILAERNEANKITEAIGNVSLAKQSPHISDNVNFVPKLPNALVKSEEQWKDTWDGDLSGLINTEEKDIIYRLTDEVDGGTVIVDGSQSVLTCVSGDKKSVSSYEKMIDRSEHMTNRFRPNRDLKISEMNELPNDFFLAHTHAHTGQLQDKEHQCSGHSDKSGRAEHVSPLFDVPAYVYSQAQTVSLQESFRLQEKHQENLERVQIEHTAHRLAEKAGRHSDTPRSYSGVPNSPETTGYQETGQDSDDESKNSESTAHQTDSD